jgi:(p)ppGpp synthase/HD superfamily hydrolase
MTLLLKRALDLAAVWHAPQRRKYPGADVPYMSHCAGVAVRLARHGFDEEVQAAGALHDCMEDAGITQEVLFQEFGERVATLVAHCSEPDKSLSWEERKANYLEHFGHKPWEAQAITLADKLDNFESIRVCARYHGEPWAAFKRGREAQLERFDALADKIRQLAPHPLILEYLEELERVRAL